MTKVHGDHENGSWRVSEVPRARCCHLRERIKCESLCLLTLPSFLSLLFPKDCGFPGAAQGAILGWDVLQALNGMGGDLRLLPDVALKTLISNGVFSEKGKGGRGENETRPPPSPVLICTFSLRLFSMYVCNVYSL